jgi:hypothetical protein
MSALLALLASAAAQATQPATGTAPAPTTVPEPTNGRSVGHRTYLDVEAGAGYSTNPQLSFVNDSGSAQGYISLHGVHTMITDRTTTLISAFAQETAYTHNYGSNESLSLTARHDAAVNEHLSLYVDGAAGYDKNGLLDTRVIGVPVVPPLPGAPDIPPQVLPSGSDFLAVSGKHYFFSADGGGQLALSALDSLDFSSGVRRSVFHDGSLVSGGLANTAYWSIPASIGYSRRVSPRAQVGGRVAFDYTDYDGSTKFWSVTPQVTANLQLSERTSLNGAIGASFTSIDNGITTRHSTGLSGNIALCNSGERSHLCVRAAVDQETATVAGPAKTISGGIDYSRQLDANSSILLSVDASRYSQPVSVITGQNFSSSTYFRAAAGYTRQFGHRLFGGINLAARKLSQRGPDPQGDFNASLFIRYRFGDVQ